MDDTDFNLLPLQILINTLFNVETDSASNGQIAYDMFKDAYERPCLCDNRYYKLILMDLQMPVMDGFESGEKILNLLADQKDLCHIVALTSYTSEDVR